MFYLGFSLATLLCAALVGCSRPAGNPDSYSSPTLIAAAALPLDSVEPAAELIPEIEPGAGSMFRLDLPTGVAMAAGSLVLSVPKASSQPRPVLAFSWRDQVSASQQGYVSGVFDVLNGPGQAYFELKPQQWELLVHGEEEISASLPDSSLDRDIKIAWQKIADNWQFSMQDLTSGQTETITTPYRTFAKPRDSQQAPDEKLGFALEAIFYGIPPGQPQVLQIQRFELDLSAAHKDNCRLLSRGANDQLGAVALSQDQKRCQIGPSQMRGHPNAVGGDADSAATNSTLSR